MQQAFEKMRREFGTKLVYEYKQNAQLIINGENVSMNEIKVLKRRKRFRILI